MLGRRHVTLKMWLDVDIYLSANGRMCRVRRTKEWAQSSASHVKLQPENQASSWYRLQSSTDLRITCHSSPAIAVTSLWCENTDGHEVILHLRSRKSSQRLSVLHRFTVVPPETPTRQLLLYSNKTQVDLFLGCVGVCASVKNTGLRHIQNCLIVDLVYRFFWEGAWPFQWPNTESANN